MYTVDSCRDFTVLGWFYDRKEIEEEEIVVYTGERGKGGKGGREKGGNVKR